MKLFRRRRFRPKPLTMRRRTLLVLAVALPVLAIAMFGSRGIFRRLQLESQAADTRQQLYLERAKSDSLRHEISRYANDTATIERLARERYGMVRSGEIIYRVPE
ncbi:MAG: septum formation initiator family protein [Chlorobi bacterium]|nr:MAG: Cell division protein FtsB [Chlorobi bacterium OLB7]MBK8910041.1 septum formation initiator family protein [Chlorobiota bacterium]MBX7217491.1 septum formation initiator family protein [Candidatus Kapabacteria bacterium]